MEEKKPYRHPLVRDGQSQDNRTLVELSPDYVKIDERTRDDFIAFAREYSKLIHYVNPGNSPAGTWEEFFGEEVDKCDPHYSLYLAFIHMMGYAQQEINSLTSKHLNHYYRDILRLASNPSKKDSAHLIFTLGKNVDNHKISKGTLLKAGKDGLGKELFYAVDKDIIVNKTICSGFKSLYVESFKNAKGFQPVAGHGIYASPIANSIDGLGADEGIDGLTWKGFGQSQEQLDNPTMPKAEIGFAISSPILYLKEGVRTIELTLIHDRDLRSEFIPFFIINLLKSDLFSDAELELLRRVLITKDTEEINEASALLARVKTEVKEKNLKIGTKTLDTLVNEKNPSDDFEYLELALDLQINNTLINAFEVCLTGHEGWTIPKVINGKLNFKTINLKLELGLEDPSIIGFNPKLHSGNLATNLPVIRFMLNTDDSNDSFRYHFLRNLNLGFFKLAVSVKGVKDLILQNDIANLKADKPFLPFGPTPYLGANFYIGSEEVFQKNLKQFNIYYEWVDAPNDFNDHYAEYNTELNVTASAQNALNGTSAEAAESEELADSPVGPITNSAFEAKLKLLHMSEWKGLTNFKMFQEPRTQDEVETEPNSNSLEIRPSDASEMEDYDRGEDFQRIEKFDNSSSTGFIKIELSKPHSGEFTAFGHKWYPKLYASNVMKDNDGETLPNEPYTPLMTNLSLDYDSDVRTGIDSLSQSQESIFHITPFGNKKVGLENEKVISLLPRFHNEGSLFIGLENLEAPQNVSVLFELDEKTVNNDYVGKVKIQWSYLVGNEWVAFTDKQILVDHTDTLTRSGIIEFAIPKEISKGSSIMPADKFWIKAEVKENTLGTADIKSIRAQAITASFVDMGNDPKHLDESLVAGAIKKFKINDSSIKEIVQPYASFGGQLAETDTNFYKRVSERLRHKKRAINLWDYERLILEAFPEVFKVKCLTHTHLRSGEVTNCSTEMMPGALTLIIIAKVDRNANEENRLVPIANIITINNIKKYLASKCNPFLLQGDRLLVRNPDYEPVQIKCSVKFNPGFDVGYYTREVENDIKKFLAPWAFNQDNKIGFERRIYKSTVIDFIEELPYIKFVCCFKMYHTTGEGKSEAENIIEASNAAAILVSDTNHIIKNVEGDLCDCEDEGSEGPEEIMPGTGIGSMIIEYDFEVK